MSDSAIKILPEDPFHVPAANAQKAAEIYFRAIAPDSESVKSIVSETIEFHDCGENFESISYHLCGKPIGIDWWQEKMDSDFQNSAFKMAEYELPCCSQISNLNDLNYLFPQGFSKYHLVAFNPRASDLSVDQKDEFARIFSCKVKIIYQYI